MADGEYKKVYKTRVRSELKLLKTQNSPYAEKLQKFFEEAEEEMKQKLKKKLIISAVILGVMTIAGLILGIAGFGDFNAGTGILAGVFGGFIFACTPHMGFSNNRREDNE